MNASTDTIRDDDGLPSTPNGATFAPAHPTHRFAMLLRREFWEHKGGFLWAPLIGGAISLLLTLIGGGTGQYFFNRHGGKIVNFDGREMPLSEVNWSDMLGNASAEDLGQMHDAINLMTLTAAAWPFIIFGFVVFFYFLGCLYDERKDRSVLFWKSLPISDRDTVLSKLVTGLVVAPLIAAALGLLTMIGFGLIASLFIGINGANPFTLYWSQLDPLVLLGSMLSWIPIYALWALPTAGWLMLCSAWAKKVPFLWAVALPLVAGLLVAWFDLLGTVQDGTEWFWENIVARALTSAWPGSHFLGYAGSGYFDRLEQTPDAMFGLDGMLVGSHLLARPALWIGALVGIAMIFAAIRLRRWRDEG